VTGGRPIAQRIYSAPAAPIIRSRPAAWIGCWESAERVQGGVIGSPPTTRGRGASPAPAVPVQAGDVKAAFVHARLLAPVRIRFQPWKKTRLRPASSRSTGGRARSAVSLCDHRIGFSPGSRHGPRGEAQVRVGHRLIAVPKKLPNRRGSRTDPAAPSSVPPPPATPSRPRPWRVVVRYEQLARPDRREAVGAERPAPRSPSRARSNWRPP
jgi:hypothetical protein